MRACSPLGEGYPRSQAIGKVCRSRICNVRCRNLLMCICMLCNTSNLPWRARRTSGYACLSLSNICEFLFCCTRRCTNRELCLVRAGLLSRVLKRLCRAKLQRQRPICHGLRVLGGRGLGLLLQVSFQGVLEGCSPQVHTASANPLGCLPVLCQEFRAQAFLGRGSLGHQQRRRDLKELVGAGSCDTASPAEAC